MCKLLSIRITKQGGEDMGGVWLSLPSTEEQFKAALNALGMKEAVQRDILISDYKTTLSVLGNASLIQNADLNELNFLAARLAALPQSQLDKLEAVGESPHHLNSISQIIDYTYNTDYFVLIPGIRNTEDLAQHYIFDSGMVEMPDEWRHGIDLYAFGINIEQLKQGNYTSKGYLLMPGSEWTEQYRAGDIPARYRLFNYLAAAEMSAEQNYNQIDGIVNNESPRHADLKDGQTWDEIEELAPGTLRQQEKPSILSQLVQSKADVADCPALAKNHQRGSSREL